MENYFIKKMAVKSTKELQEIIDNKNSFDQDAYIAAICELEKRKLASASLIAEKQKMIDVKIEKQQAEEEEDSEKKVDRKKAFTETLELLKPSKSNLFTTIIIYSNILIFILMVISGVNPIEPSIESLIIWGGNLRTVTLSGEPWRLFTSVFVHAGIFHLLLNMYAFLHVGALLESKFGKARYLFTYITTGLFASIASISINHNVVSIGASGAVFGIYGLLLSLLSLKVLDIPKESRKNLISSILFFIGYNLFYGFTQDGIDNAAHIGGFMSGFVIGFLYFPSFKQPKLSKFISAGLTAILIVSVFILPKVISSKEIDFQLAMKEFSIIEEKALWMYREDFSLIKEDKKQYYYDKLKIEGIELWEDNRKLLSTLTDMPPHLQETVDLLNEYCQLRIQSCEVMQNLIKNNKSSDMKKIEELNKGIETIINNLQKLNE